MKTKEIEERILFSGKIFSNKKHPTRSQDLYLECDSRLLNQNQNKLLDLPILPKPAK